MTATCGEQCDQLFDDEIGLSAHRCVLEPAHAGRCRCRCGIGGPVPSLPATLEALRSELNEGTNDNGETTDSDHGISGSDRRG